MNGYRSRWWRVLLLGLLLLGGCGQLEVGIESTAPGEGTEVVAQTTATPSAERPSPTSSPTTTATAVPNPPTTPSPIAVPSSTYTPSPPPPAPTNTAAPGPAIQRFSVSPQTVEPQARLRLNWEATGAEAEICIFQNGYSDYRDCRETAVSGALSWDLDDALRDDFVVELAVRGGGERATEIVSVAVICPDGEDWWFFTPPPAGCPAAEAVTSQAAAQPFERGRMLWLEKEDIIYAFFADNTYARFSGSQLQGDIETGDGGVVAPEGLVAPVRGFGLVWRGEVEGMEDNWVGEKLGWGLTPEFGFETQYQPDTHPTYTALYLRDGDGRIIYLDPSLPAWSVYHEAD